MITNENRTMISICLNKKPRLPDILPSHKYSRIKFISTTLLPTPTLKTNKQSLRISWTLLIRIVYLMSGYSKSDDHQQKQWYCLNQIHDCQTSLPSQINSMSISLVYLYICTLCSKALNIIWEQLKIQAGSTCTASSWSKFSKISWGLHGIKGTV